VQAYLVVFLGAGIGGAMRHWMNVATLAIFGPGFPFGTMIVNIAGSFAMGLFAGGFALKSAPGSAWRLFLATGVLGGFTTFSAFSLEAAMLFERGSHWAGVAYVLLSVLLSIVALFAGLALARQLA